MKNTKSYFKVAGNYFFAILFLMAVFTACEKIEKPYLPKPTPPVVTTDTNLTKILVEDYTGHDCINCPTAARTIIAMEEHHPMQVIPVAIHCTYGFAKPTTTKPQDFRTVVGDQYFKDFSIPATLPAICISRKKLGQSGGYDLKVGENWDDLAKPTLNLKPDVYIKITNSYDDVNRKITSNLNCKFYNDLSGNYSLVVLLTEDSIIAPQSDGSKVEPNYVHMHVLRDAISSSTGVSLVAGSVVKGDIKAQSFIYTVPAAYNYSGPGSNANGATIPNPKHLHVVAFIYNDVTKEVIQAQSAKVK